MGNERGCNRTNTAADAEFCDICMRREEVCTHGAGMLTGKVERRERSHCVRGEMSEGRGVREARREQGEAKERMETEKSERVK